LEPFEAPEPALDQGKRTIVPVKAEWKLTKSKLADWQGYLAKLMKTLQLASLKDLRDTEIGVVL
jgi:hypothetical protein